MFSENEKISLRQLQALIILYAFGTGVITLPRKVAESADQNGWISVALGAVIIFIYIQILNMLAMKAPHMTFVELSKTIMGNVLGTILSLGLWLKLVITAGFEVRVFCEILREMMLGRTPLWVCGILMTLICAYAASKGYECRGRIAEILILVIFIPVIFVFILSAASTDFSNLLPIMTATPSEIISGSIKSIFIFQGIEILLLIYPFLNKPEKANRAINESVIFLGITLTIATILTICRFGPENVKMKIWPVIQLMDTIDFPGSFIERQDILILWFWFVSVFSGVSAGIFFSSLTFSRAVEKKEKQKNFVFLSVVLVFIISLIPEDVAQTYEFMEKYSLYSGILYIFIIPVLLLLIYTIRTKGGNINEI